MQQITDFGMARDVADDHYYVAKGGKIPLRWTSPEVCMQLPLDGSYLCSCINNMVRQSSIRNIQCKVMCGALDV